MDIERVMAAHILKETGIKTVLEVPSSRPEEFISVELEGGTNDRFVKRQTLTAQSWAKTRKRAAEIAAMVEAAVLSIDEENIFSAVPTNTYRWADTDSGSERYQTNISVITCE